MTPTAVFPEHRYGLIQPRSKVTADDVVRFGLAIAEHEEWRPGFTEVWDTRFATIDLSPGDIPVMIDLERRTEAALEGSETIILSPRDLILYSVRFYRALAGRFGRSVRAVRTEQEVILALGIDKLPDLRDL